jgi:hypothetical protein
MHPPPPFSLFVTGNTFNKYSVLRRRKKMGYIDPNTGEMLLQLMAVIFVIIIIGLIVWASNLIKKSNARAKQTKSDHNQSDFAIASMVIGILGLFTWLLPICGFPSSIGGLVLGLMSINSTRRGTAIAGIIMCAISLVASIVNAIIGASMFM